MNQNDLLNFAVENGIIDIDTIQAKAEMAERTRILKAHNYSVWQGKDGFWHTYLPNPSAKNGRKAVKKSTQEEIEDAIVCFYKNEQSESNLFKNRWDIWLERQRNCGRDDNTIYKYEADYRRFIKGYSIENKNVKYITSDDISAYLLELLKSKKTPTRALKSLFGYLKGVFEKCRSDHIITENPCSFVDLPVLYKYCIEKPRDQSNQSLIKDEQAEVIKSLEEKENIPRLLIELSMCTGMRVGEIAGLKWSDIDCDNRVINIVRSEKCNRKTRQYYISQTKTKKVRQFPLIEQAKNVLDKIHSIQQSSDCLGEFIATDSKGKINVEALSRYGRRLTRTDRQRKGYSIHAIRRTLNSNMRHNGMTAKEAATLLGHSEKVNEMNYTVDITSMDERFINAEKSCIMR